MQEVSTTNEQKQCNNPETSNAIARGNTVHTDCHLKGYRACSLSFFIASWLLAVQTVGRAECSSNLYGSQELPSEYVTWLFVHSGARKISWARQL